MDQQRLRRDRLRRGPRDRQRFYGERHPARCPRLPRRHGPLPRHRFSGSATYYYRVRATADGAASADSNTASATTPNGAPTIATPAAATATTVTGTGTNLSVLGADDGGENHLTYTWSVRASRTAAPPTSSASTAPTPPRTPPSRSGRPAPTLSPSPRPDAAGLTPRSSVTVTVSQTATRSLRPGAVRSAARPAAFAASDFDQFGSRWRTSPPSPGASTAAGRRGSAPTACTAAGHPRHRHRPRTSVYGAHADRLDHVRRQRRPHDRHPAAASPAPVTGTTTNLSVLGADDGGEPGLTYTWVRHRHARRRAAPTSATTAPTPPRTPPSPSPGRRLHLQRHRDRRRGLVPRQHGRRHGDQQRPVVTPSSAGVATARPSSSPPPTSSASHARPAAARLVRDAAAGGSVSPTGVYTAPATGGGTDAVRATAGTSGSAAPVTVTDSGLDAPTDLVAIDGLQTNSGNPGDTAVTEKHPPSRGARPRTPSLTSRSSGSTPRPTSSRSSTPSTTRRTLPPAWNSTPTSYSMPRPPPTLPALRCRPRRPPVRLLQRLATAQPTTTRTARRVYQLRLQPGGRGLHVRPVGPRRPVDRRSGSGSGRWTGATAPRRSSPNSNYSRARPRTRPVLPAHLRRQRRLHRNLLRRLATKPQ